MGKLLFIFCLSQGHMSVCSSVAKLLLAKYPEHECYFSVDEEYYKKVKNACHLFKPILMDKLDQPNPRKTEKFQEEFRENFFKVGLNRYAASFASISKYEDLYIMAQSKIEKIIDQVKPDVILLDQLFNLPFVENKIHSETKKPIPWGCIVSTNPLFIQNSSNFPPAMSGLSSNAKKYGHLYPEYRIQKKKTDVFEKREKWYKDCDIELESNDWILRGSSYLNLYTYPRYAKYWDNTNELKGRWFQANHAILDEKYEEFLRSKNRNVETKQQSSYPGKELLTTEFLAKPGKLILFSMGTIVSVHTKVMNFLLEIIATLPHKFIVSCGDSFGKIKLPENCVGASFLNQKELYSIVDCVVTHGGNNTFCELFYYHQKPFVLTPFFADQLDNCARINDLGIGVGIVLSDLGRESLLAAIERVTTDEDMKKRMNEAVKLSRTDKGLVRFVDELHLFLKKEKY